MNKSYMKKAIYTAVAAVALTVGANVAFAQNNPVNAATVTAANLSETSIGNFTETIKLQTGALYIVYNGSQEGYGDTSGFEVTSIYTDAKTGSTQQGFRYYDFKADRDEAIKSGDAFIINPKASQYGGVVSDTFDSSKDGVIGFNAMVTYKQAGFPVYSDIHLTKKVSNSDLLGKSYIAKDEYVKDGGIVGGTISLYDLTGKFIGYVDSRGVSIGNNVGTTAKTNEKPQGAPIKTDMYVTLTGKTYTIWSGFDFKTVKHYSKNYYQKTYHVKTIYKHSNGSTYYSLYDNKNKWFGYINATGTKTGSGQQGSAISANKYVTLTSKNYKIWTGFDFKTVKHYSKNYYQKTYHVKTVYNAFSGTTYLSLYDSKGKWFGYINQSGTKTASGQQGIAITYKKTVTIKKSGYTIWGSFFGKKRGTTTKYKGKKLTAKVKYNCANGSTYLSLYSGSKWIGYVNDGVAK